jgi:hypothetical protein
MCHESGNIPTRDTCEVVHDESLFPSGSSGVSSETTARQPMSTSALTVKGLSREYGIVTLCRMRRRASCPTLPFQIRFSVFLNEVITRAISLTLLEEGLPEKNVGHEIDRLTPSVEQCLDTLTDRSDETQTIDHFQQITDSITHSSCKHRTLPSSQGCCIGLHT